jgi:hypothetical protein
VASERLVTSSGEESPYGADAREAQNLPVSMYVDILSSAIDTWVEQLSGDALIEYALTCRAQMLRSGASRGISATARLAAEIAYDRALIRLCETHGVEVAITNFAFPVSERARIERLLASSGVDFRKPRTSESGP